MNLKYERRISSEDKVHVINPGGLMWLRLFGLNVAFMSLVHLFQVGRTSETIFELVSTIRAAVWAHFFSIQVSTCAVLLYGEYSLTSRCSADWKYRLDTNIFTAWSLRLLLLLSGRKYTFFFFYFFIFYFLFRYTHYLQCYLTLLTILT